MAPLFLGVGVCVFVRTGAMYHKTETWKHAATGGPPGKAVPAGMASKLVHNWINSHGSSQSDQFHTLER